MSSLFSWVHKHSLTLVFFYAPWSGQCIKVAPEILSVHKRLDNPLLTIAAVNCWVGGCREKFATYRFPRLFLYHSTYLPIEYLGDIEADAILKFLRLSLAPWTYIASSKELKMFVESYDYYFIAYMNNQKIINDRTYESFYHSTLLLINRANRPQIAVVTNKTIAAMLQLSEHGQIRSQSLHPTNIYSSKLNYTADAISNWMIRQTNKVVHILKPGHDKNSYVNKLRKGPAIIFHSSLLAVENGLIQHYLNTAVSYHDCEKTPAATKLYNEKICTSFLTDNNVCSVCQICSSQYPCVDQTSFQFYKMLSHSKQGGNCVSSLSTFSYSEQKYSTCCLYDRKGNVIKRPSAYFIRTKRTRMLNQVSILLRYMQECYTNISNSINTIVVPPDEEVKPPLSAILNKFISLDEEAKLMCGNISVPCPLDDYILRNINMLIKGLACHTNRSLNFFLLDYNKNKYLLNQIGIPHDPTLLIIDLEKEEQYMLTEIVTLKSMVSFILQYNLGLLEEDYSTYHAESKQHQTSSIKIIELTSSTFEDIAMLKSRNVFVMFYAPWCGMCKSVNLQFLKLAHIYGKDVVFSRIDGETHMLPWHYKASMYPSFILFPAYRKSYSISFPMNEDITLGSLKQFLDHNIEK